MVFVRRDDPENLWRHLDKTLAFVLGRIRIREPRKLDDSKKGEQIMSEKTMTEKEKSELRETVEGIEQELALLRALEKSERRIFRLSAAKTDDVADHNEGIKAAQEDRAAILKTIEDFRNGIRALPLDE